MAESGSKSETTKRFDAIIFKKKSALSARWLLLEEKKRRKNNEGGSHEAKGNLEFTKFSN